MVNARNKGHSYERQIIKKFRDRGWKDAVSSRSESKNMDDKGVDIVYTHPFYVQCKAVEKLGSVHDILASMPKETNLNIVFHKRNNKGTVVSMSETDFWKLVEMTKL